MRILKNLMKVFLSIIILYFLSYSYFVYKDVIISFAAKNKLAGKIAYGLKGHQIKVIELPSGKKKVLYTRPEEIRKYHAYVYSPCFSPKGEMIVFSQETGLLFDEKLYIMDSDGLNLKLFLDLGDAGALSPSWSPDGKKIAYVVQEAGMQGLYTIRIADRLITRISEIQPSKSQPTWSPDGKKIAFTSEQKQSQYLGKGYYKNTILGGTYITDVDSGEVEKYIDLVSQPAWSPNGKMLAGERKDGYCIYEVNLQNQFNYNLQFIISFKTFFDKGGTFPIRWSPDGKYIVFCREIWPGIAGIYVTPIDNPKKQIRIGTDHQAIIGMSWGVDAVRK